MGARITPVVVSAAVAVAVLSACSKADSNAAYAEEFSRGVSANSSQYVKQVFSRALEEGRISAEAYRDSRQQLSNCYKDSGIEFEQQEDDWGLGLVSFSFFDGDPSLETKMDECNKKFDGTEVTIGGLYSQQVVNPDKQNMDQLIADCLVRKGLVETPFDANDYREFISANSATCSNGMCRLPDGTTYPADEDPPTEGGITGSFILPGGKSANSLEALACRYAPLADLDN